MVFVVIEIICLIRGRDFEFNSIFVVISCDDLRFCVIYRFLCCSGLFMNIIILVRVFLGEVGMV